MGEFTEYQEEIGIPGWDVCDMRLHHLPGNTKELQPQLQVACPLDVPFHSRDSCEVKATVREDGG